MPTVGCEGLKGLLETWDEIYAEHKSASLTGLQET